MKTEKPRHHICWVCLRKLIGNVHEEKIVDGHLRIMHKGCAKTIKEDPDYYNLTITAKPKNEDER